MLFTINLNVQFQIFFLCRIWSSLISYANKWPSKTFCNFIIFQPLLCKGTVYSSSLPHCLTVSTHSSESIRKVFYPSNVLRFVINRIKTLYTSPSMSSLCDCESHHGTQSITSWLCSFMSAHTVLVSASMNPSHDKPCATRKRDSVTICQKSLMSNMYFIFSLVWYCICCSLRGSELMCCDWKRMWKINTVPQCKKEKPSGYFTRDISILLEWTMMSVCATIYLCWLQVEGTGFYRRQECTTCMWLVRPLFISLTLKAIVQNTYRPQIRLLAIVFCCLPLATLCVCHIIPLLEDHSTKLFLP